MRNRGRSLAHAVSGICIAISFLANGPAGLHAQNRSLTSTAGSPVDDRPDHLGATDPFGARTAGTPGTPAAPAGGVRDAIVTPPTPPPVPYPEPPPPTGPPISDAPLATTNPPAPADHPSFNQIVPWNPAPPSGIQLTDPGSEFPSVRVTGFFQVDAVWFDQNDANKRQVGDVSDSVDFRRARIGVTGDVWENVGYQFDLDFALPGRPNFMDVFIEFREMMNLPATVRVGQWRMPFGMNTVTSVRELSFLERPLPFVMTPFFQPGIGIHDSVADDNITWAVAGFRFPSDVYGGIIGDRGGYSLSTRETIVFGGDSGDALLHLGGNYAYLNSASNTFRTLSQPEVFVNASPGAVVPPRSFVNVPPFVDTGLIDGEQANLFGGEIAGRAGSLWTQAELYSMVIDRSGGPNPTHWGAYAQAGYILTGEVRPYSKANGVFTRVLPNDSVRKGGGMGAWEIVGRWSMLDLNDAGIHGGRLTDLTAGLNWYLNPRTKLQFHYIRAILDREPTGDSYANILAARAQIDF